MLSILFGIYLFYLNVFFLPQHSDRHSTITDQIWKSYRPLGGLFYSDSSLPIR